MGCSGDDLLRIVTALTEVTRGEGPSYSSFSVHGKKFGYYWPRTATAGLKQTISEQLALVAERPDVFEVQFTSGGFGWVVVTLARVDRRELTELVYEAWRLTAPEDLVATAPDPTKQVGRRRR
ncbi:MmcQ/YjbR family DNA-binding protein [Actinokineospora enzanensis]|uniref:MmcQ/YjbR family DNA-binding protein n=1 Tax=Actinokineospora enzanensis TaxID=155975 RepID=UPI000376639D|nr:MmcQ/YjbR family DNA-binding protein [Actinokineospora enzanensis]